MAISDEIVAHVLRYYHVEKWRVGTIARALKIHHSTVKRVLTKSGAAHVSAVSHSSLLEPFLPFILERLQQHPNLTASRLYAMVRERGYTGGPDYFRHLIALHRPKKLPEAYMRLRTLPGEQAQVDWGHFGYMQIGKAKRPLMAFVMVLSFSRKIFLKFYLNQRMENFLRGHEGAFTAWHGVPRVLLYDNLTSAVLERKGDAIRFNPTLLKFSSHYRFEPRPVAVARGNEKGRVERAIRYVRTNFFAGRQWEDLEDLNTQARNWCEGIASERPCPEDKSRPVRSVFAEEQPQLIKLPDNPFVTDERQEVRVGKTPYVRFDLNDYSVPHTRVQKTLTLLATPNRVFILDHGQPIAEHPRSYDKSQQIEKESHIEALAKRKKQSRLHRGQDRLTHAIPSGAALLKLAASRHYHLGSLTKGLLHLLEDYGATELEAAVQSCLARDMPHVNSVRIQLEKLREAKHPLPKIKIELRDQRARHLTVRPHDLQHYDELNETQKKMNNDDN